jgi:carboxyl-terminal processing protease
MRKARCRALVLDLRQNTGGLLRNAVRAAGLFMKEGVVVVTVDRYGTESPMQVDPNTAVTAFPVIILVDSRTASAAEVFAAALRDHGIALTVGSPTYGKAAVQKMVALPDGSALLYTSARYLTPSGRDIHEKGITIDHPLPSTLSESAVLEQAVQLAKTFVRRT